MLDKLQGFAEALQIKEKRRKFRNMLQSPFRAFAAPSNAPSESINLKKREKVLEFCFILWSLPKH
jgi:hypothetical protein